LNAAFAGFDESTLEALVVNGGFNIQVTPGTWSGPYMITNAEGKLMVKDVTVTWSTENNDIVIDLDEEEYYFDYRAPWAEFYVGVPSAPEGERLEEGIYLIEWEIEQTTFND